MPSGLGQLGKKWATGMYKNILMSERADLVGEGCLGQL